MSLKKYHQKRKFSKTPEPRGKTAKNKGPLTFVIQKHAASRLHYDFRLELDGVLKSWAVPKGPSLNPEDKRLAVMVEDHPLDYADFEGIIPKGNYGGGTVMVWDRGVYMPYDGEKREDAEKILREQLKKGHLTFILLGEKLKGEFALIKIHGMEENAWLLIKKGDEYAEGPVGKSEKDILKLDKSVKSGRSMDQIASNKERDVWDSGKKTSMSIGGARRGAPKPGIAPLVGGFGAGERQAPLLDSLPKSKMPHHIKPMLAHSVDMPFDKPNWIFELKWDGYRAIAEIKNGKVELYSRNFLNYNKKFAPVVESLSKIKEEMVLDGEVVALDKNGRPGFALLQDYPNSKGELVYYVFDILHFNGRNLVDLPLIKRKEFLREVLPTLPHIRYSDYVEETGRAFYSIAQKLHLEGIMAKDAQSLYKKGERSQSWLKIRTQKRQEAVVCGFTEGNKSRQYFGALILGVYRRGKLQYIGHTGGGFNDQNLESIYKKLEPLIQEDCPFAKTPATNAPVTWVKPKLVCEVEFKEWTRDRVMRFPIFVGMREDKSTKEVEEERVFSPNPPDESVKRVKVGKQTLELTNLNKVFWPKEKYTKADLIKYYTEIADVIPPYLKDRPQSMLRWPNGIEGESFFQKESSSLSAKWIKRISIESEHQEKTVEYLLCQDKASLIYLVNLGCIDFNPWNSTTKHLDKPDWLIIDLDPEKTSFANVITVANAFRELFEQLDIASFPKTSGKRGMHIYLPMGAKYSYEQVRQFAQLLCIKVHEKLPKLTSLVHNPKERQGKVYLDYLRNSKGQTAASVYSVRAYKGATVSTPLKWSEVNSKLDPSNFTMKNMMKRVQKEGDLFEGVMGKGVDISSILNHLSI